MRTWEDDDDDDCDHNDGNVALGENLFSALPMLTSHVSVMTWEAFSKTAAECWKFRSCFSSDKGLSGEFGENYFEQNLGGLVRRL